MRILIFDSEITGHHVEYVSHLTNYIESDTNTYFFVLNHLFLEKFPEISVIIEQKKNIHIIELSKEENQFVSKGNLFKRSLASYKVLDKYVKKLKVDKVILMYLNIFQFALAIYRTKYKINGILFFQFSRMERKTLKDKLKYFRKYFQTKLLTLNKNIENVYLLNDKNSAQNLNKLFSTDIFKMLPDPLHKVKPLEGFDLRGAYQLNQNIKIFLHFGSLGERKGTFEILKAIALLNEEELKKSVFMFIGRADKETNKKIVYFINKINKQAQVVYKEGFMDDSMMRSFFEQSDVILIPYLYAEASSGVLGHAILTGKPVIVTNRGLLGEIASQYEGGFTIDNVDADTIAKELKKQISKKNISYSFKEYIDEHTPESFSKVILH